jgi:hypothetical protein
VNRRRFLESASSAAIAFTGGVAFGQAKKPIPNFARPPQNLLPRIQQLEDGGS